MFGHGNKTRVLLNLIYDTYTNSDILLDYNMDDKNIFLCYWCHALEPRVAKDEALKTGYYLKDIINIMLVTCLRVLKIKS